VKTCPACSAKVHDDARKCPECGGEWTAEGAFVADLSVEPTAVIREETKVLEMTAGELRTHIRWGVFQGTLLATIVLAVAYFTIMVLVFSSCNAGID
jgi:hypothetical protein